MFIDNRLGTTGSNLYGYAKYTGTSGAWHLETVAGTTGTAMKITNPGTGTGFLMDQNGEAKGVWIDSEADTQSALYIEGENDGSSATTALQYDIFEINRGGGGNLYLLRDLASATTTQPMVFIEQENAGDDQQAVRIQQDADALGMLMYTPNDATASGIQINEFGGSGVGLTGLFRGTRAATATNWFYRNVDSTESASSVVLIEQDNVSDDQEALMVQQDAPAQGIWIDQNGDGSAMLIQSAATSQANYGLDVQMGSGADSSRFLNGVTTTYLARKDGTAVGSNWFYRNDVLANTAAPVVFIEQDNAGDDQAALLIQQDGTGYALELDQNGDQTALQILTSATTEGEYGLKVSTGSGANAFQALESVNNYVNIGASSSSATGSSYFYRNLAAASTNSPVVFIKQDEATDDQNALSIQNDGTGYGAYIDQNGDAQGLNIDSEATTANNHGLRVVTGQGAIAGRFSEDDSFSYSEFGRHRTSTIGSNWFYRNLALANTAGPVVLIEQDEAGDDQPALKIQQDDVDGASIQLVQNGNTCNLIVDADGTCDAGTAIVVDNSIAICAVCS